MKLQKTTCAILLGISLLGDVASAGDRRFTCVYETTTAAKGEIEVENAGRRHWAVKRV